MSRRRILAAVAGIAGVIAIVMGAVFISQGFAKNDMITKAMVAENITYTGAGGEIVGIIDTPAEAKVMAEVLQEHRAEIGSYTSLKRDDPNRQTILNAMTIENSLTLAQMGFGLVQIVQATGAFMILIGLVLGVGGVVVFTSSKNT